MSLISLFPHPQCDQLSLSKIWGSHGGDLEDHLVGCDAVRYPDVGGSRHYVAVKHWHCIQEESNFLAVFQLSNFV